ncbi:MAG TPA: hypothetical protein VH331_14070 [Allosphingosinicella sp.]|jgi:outer membrane murein-binding lipoprotein Lpp|nr:hypothetical protein [Allosphingosinicella sp.]
MPVWLTIVASVAAGVGVYFVSPAINRHFEVDKARSEHLSHTTNDLNDQIIQLSQKVRRLNDALANDSKDAPVLRQDCLDAVTKLQWMLVDLRVVLKTGADLQAITKLSHAINSVKAALDNAVDRRAVPQLLLAMRQLGEQTRDVLDRLYVAASLK